jgi:hypothetical protein
MIDGGGRPDHTSNEIHGIHECRGEWVLWDRVVSAEALRYFDLLRPLLYRVTRDEHTTDHASVLRTEVRRWNWSAKGVHIVRVQDMCSRLKGTSKAVAIGVPLTFPHCDWHHPSARRPNEQMVFSQHLKHIELLHFASVELPMLKLRDNHQRGTPCRQACEHCEVQEELLYKNQLVFDVSS